MPIEILQRSSLTVEQTVELTFWGFRFANVVRMDRITCTSSASTELLNHMHGLGCKVRPEVRYRIELTRAFIGIAKAVFRCIARYIVDTARCKT